VVDTSGANLRDGIRDQVRALTGNRGADVVIEVVGGDVFDGALRALAWRGRLVTLGFAGGSIPKLSLNAVLLKNIEISGLHWSDYREWHPDWMRRAQEHLFRLYEEEKLPATIDRALPLAQVIDAMALLRDRKVMGKVVLTMGEPAQREQSNT
jgi:NADPH2:quinone reductase